MLLIADTSKKKVQEVYDYQQGKQYIQVKLIEPGDISRTNNLRIDVIMKEKKGTRHMCKEKVKDIFRENLGIEKTITLILHTG